MENGLLRSNSELCVLAYHAAISDDKRMANLQVRLVPVCDHARDCRVPLLNRLRCDGYMMLSPEANLQCRVRDRNELLNHLE